MTSHLEEWCAIVILDMVEDTARKVSSDILIFAWHDLTMDFFWGGIVVLYFCMHFFCTFRCYIGTQCCVSDLQLKNWQIISLKQVNCFISWGLTVYNKYLQIVVPRNNSRQMHIVQLKIFIY